MAAGRWITQAQAERLRAEAMQLCRAKPEWARPCKSEPALCTPEGHRPLDAIGVPLGCNATLWAIYQAIDEATMRPGDAGWCSSQNCHYWQKQGVFPSWYDCGHPDYREGVCPKEAK